jgi:hypothetical protein
VGWFGQFLINKTRRSKFFAPSRHQSRPVRILAIEKTFLPQFDSQEDLIALAKYATIGNCLSCFDHQRRGSSTYSNGTSSVWNHDNSPPTFTSTHNHEIN